METKQCTRCAHVYPMTREYYHRDKQKVDGFRSDCKVCSIKDSRKFWSRDKDRINEKRRTEEYKRTKINKVNRSIANKKYNTSELGRAVNRLRKVKNRVKLNELSVLRNQILKFRLRKNIRGRLKVFLKHDPIYDTASAYIDKHILFSHEQLKARIEMRFKSGMSWNNYGEWHLDHIKPLSLFNLEDEREMRNACALSNLQPLWAVDNVTKGNRYVG